MKFKRCDRCNVEIEEATGKAKVWEFITENITNITRAIAGKPTMAVYRDKEPADLCPDCKKDFDRWLKAGSKSQHQNEEQEPASDRNTKIVIAAIEDPTQPNPAGPKTVEFGKF